MNKIFCLIFLSLFLSVCSLGQIPDNLQTSNIRAGGFSWDMGDAPETWDNMKNEKFRDFKPNEDTLAIAICSTDPLSVALSMAAGNTMNNLFDLEHLGIISYDEKTGLPLTDEKTGLPISYQYYVPRDRVVFLRQTKKCRLFKDNEADTVYWIVHPNNELPEFIEARGASDLFEFYTVYDDNYFPTATAEKRPDLSETYQNRKKLTPEVYKTAMTKTISLMKEKRTAVTIIKISYWGRYPSRTLVANTLQAQKFLSSSGIGSYRVFVRKISYGNEPDMMEFNNKYPAISVVYEK